MVGILANVAPTTVNSALTNPTNSTQSTTQTSSSANQASTVLGASVAPSVTGSALLGTSSAAATLLGASDDDSDALFGSIASPTSSLLQQIEATANQRLTDTLNTISQQATDQENLVEAQSERWINVQAQINNAAAAVSTGQDSITNNQNTLLAMRDNIAGAGDPTQDKQQFLDAYNAQINDLNNEAESAGTAFNLVGNINQQTGAPNTVEYTNSINLTTSTVSGTYIGTSYSIVGNDGTTWTTDDSGILQAYKTSDNSAETYATDGATIPKATSTSTGIKLLSYDPNTKNISVQITVVPTDPPITVTGKLQQNGIGVMQSWFYNDFATQADRNKAFNDIDNAAVNLESSSATLQAAQTTTDIDNSNSKAALSALSAQTTQLQTDEQNATQAAQIKAAQQYQAMAANLQNMQSQQSNYLAAFSDFIGDDFTSALLDINA